MSNKAGKILFIEDELPLAEIVKETLELRGFEVIHKVNGYEGIKCLHDEKPDIILLDINLPDTDGYTIARNMRHENLQTPIIFLTSRQLPQDVVAGFENGGNDYVKKPFSIEELIVRIKALLSKNRNILIDHLFEERSSQIGQYIFNYHQAWLQINDKKIKITTREAELLKMLVVNRNQVLERKTILKQIWGNDDFFSGRSMDVFITKLRKYFKEDPTIKIANVRGIGYKLIY